MLTAQGERDILLTQIKRNYQPENPLPYSKISRGSFRFYITTDSFLIAIVNYF